jgi:predicted component of viral defense system (DUF524 family)
LLIHPRRLGLVFGSKTWREGVPSVLATDVRQRVGPRLFEQTDYPVFIRAKNGQPPSLEHRDPSILRDFKTRSDSAYGVINYGSEIGRSTFSLWVGNQEELQFTVEVFPSKLDYQNDYQQLLAEIREIFTGLALEYLRSTYRLGYVQSAKQTAVEWLTLLRSIISDLERALFFISQRPQRALTREELSVRVEAARRPDASMRRAATKEGRSGRKVYLDNGLALGERIQERRARSTLDTPEHRWLKAQLVRIRRDLAVLRLAESKRERNPHVDRTLAELSSFESKLARLIQLEPLAAAEGLPPAGFASLRLLASPGYREAYSLCLSLSQGLRLTGDAVELSVKNLATLYEYWCYLTVLRTLAELTGRPIAPRELLTIEQKGLSVRLRKGSAQSITFDSHGGRAITVTYNPRFEGKWILLAQQPDIVVAIREPNWPDVCLILDAKYRIDASEKYVGQYKSPGPPQDSINALHRYRDAILEIRAGRPRRVVVKAAALFPYHEVSEGSFSAGRLWQALEGLGVGAIPLLPGESKYLRLWLKGILSQGGWSLAEQAITHRSQDRLADWRLAASQSVLVGSLRGEEQEHLRWIQERGLYYTPLTGQPRLLSARYLAIYSPDRLRRPGAVAHWAEIRATEIVERRDIETPWAARDPNQSQVLYKLGEVLVLKQPVENLSRQRFPTLRWTSRLALFRAKRLEELLLETEPEWRLYEALMAAAIPFSLEADSPRNVSPNNPTGRSWFVTGNCKAQYRGADGFLIVTGGESRYAAHVDDVRLALG